MCETCITDYLSDGPKPCPSKQIDCGDILLDMKNVHQDNAANKEVGNLIVNCPFQPCEYSTSLKNMVTHVETCEYREIECEKCNVKVPINLKEDHTKNKCNMRTMNCIHCHDQMSYKYYHEVHLNCEHGDLCLKFIDICPNKCEIKEKINLKEHLKVCSNKKIECPFKSFKCDSVKMTKKDLISHFQKEDISHNFVLVERISNLEKQINHLASEVKDETEMIKEIIQKTSCSTKNYLILQKLVEDLKKHSPTNVQTIAPNITFRNANFIWKIINFEAVQNDAKRGSRISVTSDPFYTSEFGYKMCLKVYPFGDGVGKGTHLSVFFAIMKGEYDDLLSWPFKQKVTLSILDQESGVKHYTETFKPDIQSICYQKPVDVYNTASGSPKFMLLSEIRNDSIYRKSDTIYLKISVDTTGLPKP